MRIIRDFQCANKHVTEKYIDNTVDTVECPECGAEATRIISPVRSMLDPISGHFPGATQKWVNQREQHMKLERKTAERHGSDTLWTDRGHKAPSL